MYLCGLVAACAALAHLFRFRTLSENLMLALVVLVPFTITVEISNGALSELREDLP